MTIQIGIEIEMKTINGNEVMEVMEAAGANCYGSICGYHGGPDANSGQWKMERDGSLHGPDATMTHKGAMEVISPILYGPQGVATVNRILTGLVAKGATVDRECGTHISVGLNNKARWVAMSPSKKQEVANRIVAAYNHFQPVFDAISANCRSAGRNGYIGHARRLDDYATEHQAAGGRGSRGGAVNLAYYIQFGRIEFRQPGYTLSKKNIGRWLKIINSMVSMALNENHCSRSMNLATMPVTVDGFSDYLGLRLNVRESVRARVLQLYNDYRRGRVERLAVLATASAEAECISCGDVIENCLDGQNLCEGCE